jgi:TolB-like protein/DNA-binding winged helix-turn-helix (wHTH) protein/Tfp pilus assembly protein PilF
MPDPLRYRFGPFTLDPASFRLDRDSNEVPLTPKAFDLLVLLVRERRRGLTKTELFDAVWPDTAVTENTLTQRIKEIREALGDNSHEPIYIRTIPRVGFQFIAEVVEALSEAPVPDPTPRPVPEAPPGEPEASPERAPVAPGPVRRWTRRQLAWVTLLVMALAATGAFVYRARTANPPPGAAASDRRIMLAILPFENLGGDPEQAYFSDGLTEEMITELGRLDPAQLGVIARTSSMAYKGTTKSIAEIAKELGVDYILEGSVRRESDRLRIVAQLIRASDQTHVWAEPYDRDLGSILSLQREVARAIAAGTRFSLSAEAAARLARPLKAHPDAEQAYLRGRFFLNQRTGDSIQKAREQFEQAIARDPAYAQAHAGLADAWELLASYANVAPGDALERAMAAARRALELDPELSDAYTSLATIHTSYTWDWAEAEKAYRRALQLNPSSALGHKGFGELLSKLGRHDEAIIEATRAAELDPLSLLMQANLGITDHRARRYDMAVRQMQHALGMDPNYMLAHFNLGMILAARGAYEEALISLRRASSYVPEDGNILAVLGYACARAGRIAEARAIGAQLQKLSAEGYVSAYSRGIFHLGLGEREHALAQLEQAYEERSWLVSLLKVDPLFDDLRGEPQFEALVRRLNFPR